MTFTAISPEGGPAARYTATGAFYLTAVFLVLISFPGWDLPGGVTIAQAWMALSFPFWFHAARLRAGPVFDAGAEAGVMIILPATIFLTAWAFLSVVGLDSPFRAGRSIASMVGAVAVYFAVVGTITGRRLDAYLKIASITLALTCLVSFIALADPTLRGAIYRGSDRAAGFFKNPNQLGIAITTLAPVAIGCFIVERRHRLFWGICVSLFMLGLVLSGSKANLLLTAFSAGVMILSAAYVLHTGRRRAVMMVVASGAYVILMVVGFVLLSVLNPRAVVILTRFFSPDAEVQSLQSRAVLWEYSIDQFMADPFFGQGAGQRIEFLDTGRQVAHSHNIILDYIRTLGLPGLTGFLIIAATAVILSFGAMRMALASEGGAAHTRVVTMGLAVGSVAYLAANVSSDSMGPSTSSFFWVVFFLCLSSRRRLLPPA